MADNENRGETFEAGRVPATQIGDKMPGSARNESPTAEYPEVADDADRDRVRTAVRDREDRDRDDDRDRRGPAGDGAARGFRTLFWAIASIGLVIALVLGAQGLGWLPKFKNPFATQTTDRSAPPLLQSIQDLSRYVPVQGNFQVIIDVQQNQKYIPDFLVNERVLFVAVGDVQAYVDFGNIGQGAIKESDDRRTVEITLPAPLLDRPRIDNEKTYVYTMQRGLLNRIRDAFSNDPNRLQEVYKLAEQKIAEAASASELIKRAEENTTKMLQGMLSSLGYTSVTVVYQRP